MVDIEEKKKKSVPNVSGSFQVVSEEQQQSLGETKESGILDEECMYYARIFMED